MLDNFCVFEGLVFFGLWIPDSGSRIPDSGFRFPDSGFRFPGLRVALQGTPENGAKTERIWHLMWKTADRKARFSFF